MTQKFIRLYANSTKLKLLERFCSRYTFKENRFYAKSLLLGQLSKVDRPIKWHISNRKQKYALFSFRRYYVNFESDNEGRVINLSSNTI